MPHSCASIHFLLKANLDFSPVIPNLWFQKGAIKLNPATSKNRRPPYRWVSLIASVILLLLATAFLIPDLVAQPADPEPAGPRWKAAIPKEHPGGPAAREELAKGKFLVADRQLTDPNFRETVVLLIEYSLNGAMGLVINRPSNVTLATVFPNIKELKQRKDILYVGGPVAVNQMLLLIGTNKAPDQATPVSEGVYISSSWELLERLMKKKGKGERFRLFAGYAGWAPDQLDFERSRGDWHVLKAEADMVFSQKPEELWPELIRRVTVKWVRVQLPRH